MNLGVAKDQRLSLNPSQISGACGRLMCCLRYEHEFYVQSRKRFPKEGRLVKTKRGDEKVVGQRHLPRTRDAARRGWRAAEHTAERSPREAEAAARRLRLRPRSQRRNIVARRAAAMRPDEGIADEEDTTAEEMKSWPADDEAEHVIEIDGGSDDADADTGRGAGGPASDGAASAAAGAADDARERRPRRRRGRRGGGAIGRAARTAGCRRTAAIERAKRGYRRRRRRRRGGERRVSGELLSHHGDRLRERRTTHRPRVRENRRGRDCAISPDARRRRVFPHRARRARAESRAGGGGRGSVSPQAFVDRLAERFERCGRVSSISYDQFMRTTEARAQAGRASALIERIHERSPDDFYEQSYEGWYCVGCELFKRDDEIVGRPVRVPLRRGRSSGRPSATGSFG